MRVFLKTGSFDDAMNDFRSAGPSYVWEQKTKNGVFYFIIAFFFKNSHHFHFLFKHALFMTLHTVYENYACYLYTYIHRPKLF